MSGEESRLVASYYGGSLVYDYGAGMTGSPAKAP